MLNEISTYRSYIVDDDFETSSCCFSLDRQHMGEVENTLPVNPLIVIGFKCNCGSRMVPLASTKEQASIRLELSPRGTMQCRVGSWLK